MFLVQADLRHSGGYEPVACNVKEVVTVYPEQYKALQRRPADSHDCIRPYKHLMGRNEGTRDCILVLGGPDGDGILLSGGLSAQVPGAAAIVEQWKRTPMQRELDAEMDAYASKLVQSAKSGQDGQTTGGLIHMLNKMADTFLDVLTKHLEAEKIDMDFDYDREHGRITVYRCDQEQEPELRYD